MTRPSKNSHFCWQFHWLEKSPLQDCWSCCDDSADEWQMGESIWIRRRGGSVMSDLPLESRIWSSNPGEKYHQKDFWDQKWWKIFPPLISWIIKQHQSWCSRLLSCLQNCYKIVSFYLVLSCILNFHWYIPDLMNLFKWYLYCFSNISNESKGIFCCNRSQIITYYLIFPSWKFFSISRKRTNISHFWHALGFLPHQKCIFPSMPSTIKINK